MARSCEDCSNCLLMDFGYSNWTVEGTSVLCMVDVHPDKEFDRWYGEDDRLKFAEQCERFSPGGAERLDVDREDFNELSAQAQEFLGGDR